MATLEGGYEVVVHDDGRVRVYRESDGKNASPRESRDLGAAITQGYVQDLERPTRRARGDGEVGDRE